MDQEYESVLSDWHSRCDTYTSTPFSTPTLRTPTSTIVLPAFSNVQKCQSIETLRATASLIRDCYLSYPAVSQDAQFKSCACRQNFYTAAFVCEYDGNVTCFSRPATRASIGLWHVCGQYLAEVPKYPTHYSHNILRRGYHHGYYYFADHVSAIQPASLPASSAAVPSATSSAAAWIRLESWVLKMAALGALFCPALIASLITSCPSWRGIF